MKRLKLKKTFHKENYEYRLQTNPCYITSDGDRFYRKDFEEAAASLLDGNDHDTVSRWAQLIFDRCDGLSPGQTAARMQDELAGQMDILYLPGTKVYLLPYNYEDIPGINRVIRYTSEVTMITDGYTEQEVTLSEIYRKAPHVCPRCGSQLFHEKWNSSRYRYPYVCFACDENYFKFEINQ